jgi:hypothetical protein
MHLKEENVVSLLRKRGLLTAREIAVALEASQPTVSRWITKLGPQRTVRVGQARSTRYALRRSLRGLGSSWPLYRIGCDGVPNAVGQLYALEGGQWYVEQESPWQTWRGSEFREGLYPGLPWFLQDLRPRGFLGRCFIRNYAARLGTPLDPHRWSDDDVAVALIRFGDDLSGDLVLGRDALAAVQMRRVRGVEAIPAQERMTAYPVRADAALSGEWPGSSAAGEQPKFTACVSDQGGDVRHVIVKFSGKEGRAEDRRWADLLLSEHAANAVLSEGGVPCATTGILQSSGRFFLESTRFDRAGAHGRRGLVSLEALDAAFFGAMDTPWTEAATRLSGDGWITASDADCLSILWWFGTLIGNTDMHYGNVSLLLEPARPLSLSPAYDMVPMLYRPDVEGRFSSEPVAPLPPPPEALPSWSRASLLAERFWSRLSASGAVSGPFRQIAARNADVVTGYRRKFL